jgi:hypothetical protein
MAARLQAARRTQARRSPGQAAAAPAAPRARTVTLSLLPRASASRVSARAATPAPASRPSPAASERAAARRATSEASAGPIQFHSPSVARIRNSSAALRRTADTSGSAITPCGRRKWSPIARVIESAPITRSPFCHMTWPPARQTRSCRRARGWAGGGGVGAGGRALSEGRGRRMRGQVWGWGWFAAMRGVAGRPDAVGSAGWLGRVSEGGNPDGSCARLPPVRGCDGCCTARAAGPQRREGVPGERSAPVAAGKRGAARLQQASPRPRWAGHGPGVTHSPARRAVQASGQS